MSIVRKTRASDPDLCVAAKWWEQGRRERLF